MIYKNKELLMQACNILTNECYYYNYTKPMYKYLLNCGNKDWQTYYKNNIPEFVDKAIRMAYKQLIHSLNEFNRFKV